MKQTDKYELKYCKICKEHTLHFKGTVWCSVGHTDCTSLLDKSHSQDLASNSEMVRALEDKPSNEVVTTEYAKSSVPYIPKLIWIGHDSIRHCAFCNSHETLQENLDYYFVGCRYCMSLFNRFISRREEKHLSALNGLRGDIQKELGEYYLQCVKNNRTPYLLTTSEIVNQTINKWFPILDEVKEE